MNELGRNPTTLLDQSIYSGKFLNDLGEYDKCIDNINSTYMLGKYTLLSGYGDNSVGNSFNNYAIGMCVPKECTAQNSGILENYFTNLSMTFLTENYFNYTKSVNQVKLTYYDVVRDADKKVTETSSTASVMIVVFVFLILIGILGLVVEKTSLGNKPNLNNEEDEQNDDNYWSKYYGQDGFGAEDDQNEKMCEEYQKYCVAEGKLIKSKTLWGILLLSFSYGRNAKRLFQFSVISRKHYKSAMIEGARVIFLFWVMAGNTFLYSFFSYPANFDKKTDIAQNYLFITIFNNEFAFDAMIFFTAFLTGHDLLERFDERVFTTLSYILFIIHFIIKMIFPMVIIIGVSAVFPLFSSGPLWGVMTNEITATCDNYLWTHVIFISNLYPFKNNIGSECCLPWLWFVSTLFQFFFVSLGITMLYKRYPMSASFSTWCICLASLLICTIIASVGSTTSLSQYDSSTYTLLFTKPWSRIFGHSLGLFIGFIIYEFNKKSTSDNEKRFGWQIISWMENMNIFRRTIFIIGAFILVALPSVFQWLVLVKDPFLPFQTNSAEKVMYILYITLGKPLFFAGLTIIIVF